MRNELTLSIERNEIINAERAYELYWSGAIVDQKSFCCPDNNCPAEFTCVNMYRAANELKQQPHFRARVEHKVCCDFLEEIAESGGTRGGANGKPATPAAPLPDRFLFRRPVNDLARVEIAGNVSTAIRLGTKEGVEWVARARRRSTEFYSLGRLVSRWLQARKAGEASIRTVQFASGPALVYSKAFVSLYPRGRRIYEEARVYWGKARIGRSKDNSSYVLYFSEPVTFLTATGQNVLLKPMIVLKDKDLAKSAMRKATSNIIAGAIGNDDSWCTAFLYNTPRYQNAGAFIDLTPANLDHVAIEPIALLSELE